MNPLKETFVDVLIVGAGPAGVMCANALQSAGISVRIVDKRPTGLAAGQADGCQPRTMEIMQSYGLLDKLKKRGEHLWKSTFYNPSPNGGIERTARTGTIQASTARWSYGITLHQGGIEDIFLESMEEHGLQVERSTIPISMKLSQVTEDLKNPDAYTAEVVLEHLDREEDNREIVHAKFLLGSDGAHSWVRNALNIQMEGDVTESIWGVVDIVPDSNFPDVRSQSFVHSNAGTVIIIPRENNLIRIYIQLSANSDLCDPITGRVDKSRTSPEKLLERGREIFHPYTIDAKDGKVAWWTVYVVGQRVAERYSVNDRAFIAGDACHTHSPKAGQGLNASMGDTHNLAWKLAYVLRGWADMSLLKTYESERRTYAQTLINFDKVWSPLFTGKPWSPDNEDGITHDQFLGAFKQFGGFTSGIGIHYDPSMIVDTRFQALVSNVTIGERMPPHLFMGAANATPYEIQDLLPADTRFKILVFAGDMAVKTDRARLQALADNLSSQDSFLTRFGRGDVGAWQVFEVLCISSGKQESIDYLDFPEFFRPHWSKVLIDDVDTYGRSGGGGYVKYGIDGHAGAMVVVRPDGYVGMVAPLDGTEALDAYFASFLLH